MVLDGVVLNAEDLGDPVRIVTILGESNDPCLGPRYFWV